MLGFIVIALMVLGCRSTTCPEFIISTDHTPESISGLWYVVEMANENRTQLEECYSVIIDITGTSDGIVSLSGRNSSGYYFTTVGSIKLTGPGTFRVQPIGLPDFDFHIIGTGEGEQEQFLCLLHCNEYKGRPLINAKIFSRTRKLDDRLLRTAFKVFIGNGVNRSLFTSIVQDDTCKYFPSDAIKYSWPLYFTDLLSMP